mmetsp:Transcript_18158/g.46095  ORF Transcript_18158/g.46095 Transcript_18158/m.46095 type:complete len:227 (-) Transcript_18158:388-1068(-)
MGKRYKGSNPGCRCVPVWGIQGSVSTQPNKNFPCRRSIERLCITQPCHQCPELGQVSVFPSKWQALLQNLSELPHVRSRCPNGCWINIPQLWWQELWLWIVAIQGLVNFVCPFQIHQIPSNSRDSHHIVDSHIAMHPSNVMQGTKCSQDAANDLLQLVSCWPTKEPNWRQFDMKEAFRGESAIPYRRCQKANGSGQQCCVQLFENWTSVPRWICDLDNMVGKNNYL